MGLLDFIGLGGKLIDKLVPDAAEKQRMKLELEKLAYQGEFTDLTRSYDAIIAEAQSADRWTSRARPTFMYVMYLMILFGPLYGVVFAFFPVQAVHIADGLKAWLGAIPDSLWGLFGVGYVGYSVSRTTDKYIAAKSR